MCVLLADRRSDDDEYAVLVISSEVRSGGRAGQFWMYAVYCMSGTGSPLRLTLTMLLLSVVCPRLAGVGNGFPPRPCKQSW